MCLGNVSADFSSANALKTGLHGYVYIFQMNIMSLTTLKYMIFTLI